jgi:uncharacterized membrane protein YvbJ
MKISDWSLCKEQRTRKNRKIFILSFVRILYVVFMVFCRNCGAEVTENDKFCLECGVKQEEVKIVENEVEKAPDKKPVGLLWFIVGILLPIVGVLAGLIFMVQGRKNGMALLVVSIVVWGFFALVIIIAGA